MHLTVIWRLTLQKILDECETNTAIRCVSITGAGKAFCAGQDLSEIVDPEGPGMEKILSNIIIPSLTK